MCRGITIAQQRCHNQFSSPFLVQLLEVIGLTVAPQIGVVEGMECHMTGAGQTRTTTRGAIVKCQVKSSQVKPSQRLVSESTTKVRA